VPKVAIVSHSRDMPHQFSPATSLSSCLTTKLLVLLGIPVLFVAIALGPLSVTHARTHSYAAQSIADWLPPIQNATEADLVQMFIPPGMPWSSGHRRIDIRAGGADVLAPNGGEVTFVCVVVHRPVISIQHSNGLISLLEPVESELEVGDKVAAGQTIGSISDDASHCDAQCVHWGVRMPDAWKIGSTLRDLYIDPAFLLGWSEPSILWPVHSDPT